MKIYIKSNSDPYGQVEIVPMSTYIHEYLGGDKEAVQEMFPIPISKIKNVYYLFEETRHCGVETKDNRFYLITYPNYGGWDDAKYEEFSTKDEMIEELKSYDYDYDYGDDDDDEYYD